LYDLKTNQLINTFKRQILCKSILWDYPSYCVISNNNKLLAYLSFSIKGITIYSIECGLEIAELANILNTSIFKTENAIDRMFLYFFQNDEKLLIYYSESEFSSAVWAESDKQNWIIQDLEDLDKKSELKLDKLDKLYEPWLPIMSEGGRLPKEDDIQYSFYRKVVYNQIAYSSRVKQIKMNDEDEINIAKNACYTLEYFSVYTKKFEQAYDMMKKSNFVNFIKQTQKLILKFIRLHPTEYTLIKVGEHELVNYILFFGEPVHIPQYFPWSGKKNVICTVIYTALSEKDNTMLAFFLEYYSNYAVHNIGWMNTVVDIMPELFKKSYKYYAQILFYSPCFCDKEFDLFSFDILEVSLNSNDLLKVYIPITQLIPQNSELDLQEI
ncbi:45072_t:CDS:2, partial [Gigaspora margarita]